MKKPMAILVGVLVVISLAIPAFAQGEGPDLSPVAGKFKMVFQNCLGVSVFADAKAEGLDFWSETLPAHSADSPVCPYSVAVVRPSLSLLGTPQKYRGTMSVVTEGKSHSVPYELNSSPGGVVVVSFYTPDSVDVRYVTAESAAAAQPTATQAPTAAPTPSQPTATATASGEALPPTGGLAIPALSLGTLILVSGLVVLASRRMLRHEK
jgi:hypothetical protein